MLKLKLQNVDENTTEGSWEWDGNAILQFELNGSDDIYEETFRDEYAPDGLLAVCDAAGIRYGDDLSWMWTDDEEEQRYGEEDIAAIIYFALLEGWQFDSFLPIEWQTKKIGKEEADKLSDELAAQVVAEAEGYCNPYRARLAELGCNV